MNDPIEEFKQEVTENIEKIRKNETLCDLSGKWMSEAGFVKYSYVFKWMGRPIIQYPQDIVAMQEIIWDVKPDLIIETGIAHGGSLIYYASLMQLLGGEGHVLGIDIDIREHNRKEIENHPMFQRITMFEGSSIDDEIVNKVHNFAKNYQKVLVVLDSCHTAEHVYQECIKYSDLVKEGSYLVVMDTVADAIYKDYEKMDNLPEHLIRDWGDNNGPMAGMQCFLDENSRFECDNEICDKLLITAAPKGYLKCIK